MPALAKIEEWQRTHMVSTKMSPAQLVIAVPWPLAHLILHANWPCVASRRPLSTKSAHARWPIYEGLPISRSAEATLSRTDVAEAAELVPGQLHSHDSGSTTVAALHAFTGALVGLRRHLAPEAHPSLHYLVTYMHKLRTMHLTV